MNIRHSGGSAKNNNILVDTRHCGEAAALGVIVDRGYGYRRPDGVSVIPIGALGP